MFIKLVTAKSSSAGPLSYWWIVCQPILYALPKPTHICYNYCTLGPRSWMSKGKHELLLCKCLRKRGTLHELGPHQPTGASSHKVS
jgi:hypothetical protein